MEIAYGAVMQVASGIKLDKTEKLGANEIVDYTGSDRANDGADQKSQGGHVFLCNGGTISHQWRNKTWQRLLQSRPNICLLGGLARSQVATAATARRVWRIRRKTRG